MLEKHVVSFWRKKKIWVNLFFTLYYSLVGNLDRLTWVRLHGSCKSSATSPTSACWVFSCFRNPPNSDMDYRISNVGTYIYIRSFGKPAASQHNIFDSENSWSFSCVPDGIQIQECEVQRCTNLATLSPYEVMPRLGSLATNITLRCQT